MRDIYFSPLCRGIGIKGNAYEDHKLRYPTKIPYTLSDLNISKKKDTFSHGRRKLSIPGTYVTECGQFLLFTKEHKKEGLAKETAFICKNMKDIYNSVQSVSGKLRERNIYCARKLANLGDRKQKFSSLYNNWLFPKKWKSPAKELIPEEVYSQSETFKSFLRNKKKNLPPLTNFSNSQLKTEVEKYKAELGIPLQEQNNATSSTPQSHYSDCLVSIDNELAEEENEKDQYTKTDNSDLEGDKESLEDDLDDSIKRDQIYDGGDELVIPICRKKLETKFDQFGDYKEMSNVKLDISEALGEEFAQNDGKRLSLKSFTYLKPERLSTRMKGMEDKRICLLKDLYNKLNLTVEVYENLKSFGAILLDQFQNYTYSNRKLRLEQKRDQIFKIVQELKERNEEIADRLTKASKSLLQKNKLTMDKNEFHKERESMQLDLNWKTQWDNDVLQQKICRILESKKLELRDYEKEILDAEHSSIKSAFTKLRNELIKIEDRKQEIESFIIRLEMRRENVNKIENEIVTATPLEIEKEQNSLVNYVKNVKNDIVIIWKSKMSDLANDFKIDDRLFNDIIQKLSSIDSSVENGDVSNEKCATIKDDSVKNQMLESANKELHTDSNSITLSETAEKAQLARTELEFLRQSQRVSSNYTFSFFVPWPKESYERYQKLTESSEEVDAVPVKEHKLNYKKILSRSPLKNKKISKCLSRSSKSKTSH